MDKNIKDIEELQKVINGLYSEEIYALAFLQGTMNGSLQSIKLLNDLTDEELETIKNSVFTFEYLEKEWNGLNDRLQLELRPLDKIIKIINK